MKCSMFSSLSLSGHRRGDLLRLEDDVFALRGLVALDLVVPLDRLAGLAIDELALDAMAGRPVQRVEGDPLRLRGGGVERHGAAQFADLEETLPIRTRGHA